MSSDNLTESSDKIDGVFSTKSSPLVMSNPPQADSQLKSEAMEAENLDELKKIFASTGLAIKSEQREGAAFNVDNIPESSDKLTGDHIENLGQATRAFLNDDADLSDSLKDLVAKTYGKIAVQSYTVQEIVVTAANPWIISGQGPVVVNVDKVTVQPGGQIQVTTDASINIGELIKQ